ncbi:MAG: DUF975 family protein [Clostridiales bacterium]|nr:DUF975 family protein [Clostridiales bacterium]
MLDWTRAELKSRAKSVLRLTYWQSFAGVLLFNAILFGASMLIHEDTAFGSTVSTVITVFLALPLEVGLCAFFLRSRLAPPSIPVLFYSFNRYAYGGVVGSMFLRYLFTMLWSLLPASGVLVLLPGLINSGILPYITDWRALYRLYSRTVWLVCGVVFLAGSVVLLVKVISYSMVPYILADNPRIGARRALRLSIAMTYGYKTKIFLLGLSFAGWILLGIITFGVGLLFLEPYMHATFAELYIVLRANALQNGLCTPEELGLPPMSE